MNAEPKNDAGTPEDPNKTIDKPSPPGVPAATYHPDEAAGDMIGPYKLLQKLGKGAMGVVWMAEQREPVKRYVAVKIIKTDLRGDQVLARFEAERQALAMMDHPNIAKVLDAGATPSGRPYFVMELVKGLSFTTYCDQEKLPLKDRLELFIPVCNAVQHAHQKGVVHRDLKPSNVLIALYDGKPVPKVIDFGVAKALHQKLTDSTLMPTNEPIGTVFYMAPEQADVTNLDIDTRADIYSLGVMLYEVLTGSLPLRNEAVLEMLRMIKEVEPVKPSTKLSSSAELPGLAAKRKLEPNTLPRFVQGDLDWIVMRCLEKERARRYETANQLGEELRRFLSDEPVLAGPPSFGYRAKKFMRRNKGPVIAASLTFLALVIGISATSIVTKEALHAAKAERDARELAEKRLLQLEQANDLLGILLREVPFDAEEDHLWSPEDMLRNTDRMAARIDEDVMAPRTLALIEFHLGCTYATAGKWDKAVALLAKARDRRGIIFGVDHPETLKAAHELGDVYIGASRPEKAVPILKHVVAKREGALGPNERLTLKATLSLAIATKESGQKEEAYPLMESVVAREKKGPAPGMGKKLKAYAYETLAEWYDQDKRFEKSAPIWADLIVGYESPNFFPMFPPLEVLWIDPVLRRYKLRLMMAYHFNKDPRAVTIEKEMLLEDFNEHWSRGQKIARESLGLGLFQQAEELLSKLLKQQTEYEPHGAVAFETKSLLGASLLGQKKYKDAEPLLKEGYDGMKAREQMIPPAAKARLTEAVERLVQLYEAAGNAAEAERYRKELAECKAAQKSPKK